MARPGRQEAPKGPTQPGEDAPACGPEVELGEERVDSLTFAQRAVERAAELGRDY